MQRLGAASSKRGLNRVEGPLEGGFDLRQEAELGAFRRHGAAQTFFSSGSSSSEIIRMLERAVPSGMPAQWVRKVRWFTPNSSQ